MGSCRLDLFGCCGRGNEPAGPIKSGYFLTSWATFGFSRSGTVI